MSKFVGKRVVISQCHYGIPTQPLLALASSCSAAQIGLFLSRQVRQANKSLISLTFLPITFTNVNIASLTWQGQIVWLPLPEHQTSFETLKRESFSSPFILLDPLLLPSKLSLDKDFELMLFYSNNQSFKTSFVCKLGRFINSRYLPSTVKMFKLSK